MHASRNSSSMTNSTEATEVSPPAAEAAEESKPKVCICDRVLRAPLLPHRSFDSIPISKCLLILVRQCHSISPCYQLPDNASSSCLLYLTLPPPVHPSLPPPLHQAPKALPAGPRPDKRNLDKAVGALQAEIDKLNENIAGYDKKMEEIKKKIDVAMAARSGEQDELSKERAKRDAIKAELDKIKAEKVSEQ